MISIKKFFVILLSVTSYVACIYWLFIAVDFFYSAISLVILYVLFPLFVVELRQKAVLWSFFLLMLASSILLLIFINNYERYFILSLFLFHGALVALFYSVLDALYNRVKISYWELSHVWAYLFTVFITLSYASLLLTTYNKFPLSCESLYANSDRVIETVTYPFELWQETILTLKERISSTSSLSLGQALGISGDVFTWTTMTGSSWHVFGLFWMIDSYKTRLFDQVLADNSSVNMNICELLVGEISKKYNDPVFQFSIVLLMFLLFYPFLRMILYLIEWITWVLFFILSLFGIYKVEKVIKEVEQID